MTPETKIKTAIRRALKPLELRGELFVVAIAGGPRLQPGLPDLALVYRGRAVLLEVKSASGQTTPLQDSIMARIRRAGGVAEVVRSVQDVWRILDSLSKGDAGC